jgi:hypothetical protein
MAIYTMKYFFRILLLLFLRTTVSAQFYEFGQDPASLKWKSLDTEHFRIVFPSDFAENAQSIARLMEKNYLANSAQLNHQPSKIPLIIHNQTVYSNAFVTWAPKRMEFFTFPDPDLYPVDWLNELSLHEFRHVIQVDKINQGFTRFLSLVLGQQANGAVAGMMPLWFIEGDAVSAETSLSKSGRGRLPSFEMEIKAQILSGPELYSLSKAYLGSYKDHVPDHYQLGYQMVSYARQKYGDDYWSHALDYCARRPFLISPYYFYSKKITGEGQSFLYKNTMASIKEHWIKTAEIRKPDNESALNTRNSKVYTSYTYPRLMKDGSVIALKTGMNIIPQFVKIGPGGEEKLVFIPGSLVSGRFSIHNEKIIWDEYVQDIRWRNRSYSVLREYNIGTGKCRNLSRKTKFISPAWSPAGDSIVAVNVGTDYKFSLVILSSDDGNVLLNIPSPDNVYLACPEWIRGTGKIAVIATGEGGKKIIVYDLNNGTWSEILKTGFVNISQLKSVGGYIYFNGGFDGIDEIYSYNISDKKLRKLSNSAVGAFYPDGSDDNSILTYSSYGSKGYDIILKSFNREQQEEFVMPDSIGEQSFVSVNLRPDTTNSGSLAIENTVFDQKPYYKASHLFSVHSWAPYWYDYMDPNIHDPKVSTGITLLSQNELSTAFTSLGYERNNGANLFHTRFTYKGLVPVIDVSTNYGGVSSVAMDTILPDLKPDLNSRLSVYIPLSLTSGKIISGMQPSIQFSYSSTYYYHYSENSFKSGIGYFEPGLYAYSYLRTSARDIQPRLGITLDAKITPAVFDGGLAGNIRSLSSNLYLPGFVKNQGLRLKGEWQNQESDFFYFQNHLSLPRGYPQRIFLKMNKYSADYAFPIIYPDFSLGALLYLKRIRGNLFVDYMKGIEKFVSETVTSKPEYPLSQGLELYADYHIFRFIFELSSGVRLVYFPHENTFGAQMLFTVNLDKF